MNVKCKITVWVQVILQAGLPLYNIIPSAIYAADTSSLLSVANPGVASHSPFSIDHELNNMDDAGSIDTDMPLPYSAEMSQAARLMANGNAADSARSLASGEASSAVQGWLSQFGTARVQINTDRHGSWGHSAADLLVPLYDNQQSLLFVQGGIRKPSDRLTGNLGAGVRTFWENGWMYGGNVFFDKDFTGNNRRVGIGGEAWTDYLRLSANTYIGTSQWHTSRDFDGTWQEKPADGYDVRAEGWLPSYPQLGAKLVWEQYYGKQVALFDKDHLQHNPHAITAGVEYTPVPLVTVGVDQKLGAGEHDTQVGLDFRWTFGQNWQWQTAPENVRSSRTLNGSRYELVNRNNEIVLQYRKSPDEGVAHLTETLVTDNSPADGVTRNSVQVLATNRNGQPVASAPVSWSATGDGSAALSASTAVTDASGLAFVTLTSTKSQAVPVIAQSGSVSAVQNSHFVAVSVSHIALAVTQDNVPADGVSQAALMATLTDSNDHPVTGQKVTWVAPENVTAGESEAVSDSSGKVTLHFASTVAAGADIRVTAGSQSASQTIHFTGNAASAKVSALTVTTDGSPANGEAANEATVIITDASGNALSGQTVTWTSDKSTVTFGQSATTDGSGKTTVPYTDTAAESLTLTATLSNGNGATASSLFVSDKDSARLKDLTVTSGAKASGSDANTATVTVTDANGNALTNTPVTFSTTGSAKLSATTTNTDASGKAQVTLTDTEAETVQVTARLEGGSSMTKDSSFAADLSSATLTATATSGALADGEATNSVIATLKDNHDKALAGVPVTLTVSGNAKLSASSGATDGSGQVTVTLTDTAAENATVKASVSDDKKATAQTAFTAFAVSELKSSATSVKASGVDSATLTATVKDSNGNVVANTPVTFSSTGSAKLSSLAVTTNGSGQAQVTLTDETEESVSISAKADKSSSDEGQSVTVVMTDAGSVSSLSVNGYTFDAGSGFPTTGFKGAKFALVTSQGSASDYTWTSDAGWVSVSDGVVTFTGSANGDKVTLTGKPKNGGKAISWSFALNSWYINNGSNKLEWSAASAYCNSQSGYSMPTAQQLNGDANAVASSSGTRGTIGGLWSEWGDLSQYSGTGFVSDDWYWSVTPNSATPSWHIGVYLNDGTVEVKAEHLGPRPDAVVCRKGV